jgi:thioredoxin-like negative regulator of GroEL
MNPRQHALNECTQAADSLLRVMKLTLGDQNRQARVVILDAWNGIGLKEANLPVAFRRVAAQEKPGPGRERLNLTFV